MYSSRFIRLLAISLALFWFANSAREASASDKNTVNVATWNFACRGIDPFWLCENCGTRFKLIASAIRGQSHFDGMPDFDNLDIILGQELLTDDNQIQVISDAMADRGFKYVTAASPTKSSPQCRSPLQPNKAPKAGKSGGLVMWSRYPIASFRTRRWCVNGFPTHAGYTAAMVEVEGRYVVAINMHMMPEYNLGPIKGSHIRTYQFSEIVNLVKELEADLKVTQAPFTIILGGDFNEDPFSLRGRNSAPGCNLITNSEVIRNFNAMNFDVRSACQDKLIHKATWDPTVNDMASKFSKSGTHEILDYVIMHSSSGQEYDVPNTVYSPQYTPGWWGIFCHDTSAGYFKGIYFDKARSLSDHQLVTASVPLPGATGSSALAVNAFNASFDGYPVQRASCGQTGTSCLVDANCCRDTEYAFDNKATQCSHGRCQMCRAEGESCNWWVEGSECCGFDKFPGGLHCEYSRCVRKFARGRWCNSNNECDSRSCRWTWTGPRCR